jgi:hypothetical protein
MGRATLAAHGEVVHMPYPVDRGARLTFLLD